MDEKDLLETNEQEVVEDVDTAASDAVEQALTDAVVCDNCEESDEYKNAAVLSADELETFVGQLDDSVNELCEIVEEMNVITSDEDSESQESNNEQGKSRQSIQKTILSYLHDIAFGMTEYYINVFY